MPGIDFLVAPQVWICNVIHECKIGDYNMVGASVTVVICIMHKKNMSRFV